MTSTTDQQSSAYHEAGHVVAAWTLGLEIGRVELIDDHGKGRAEIALSSSPLENARVAIAGAACQEAFGFPCPHELAWVSDYGKASEFVGVQYPDDPERQGDEIRKIELDLLTFFQRQDIRHAAISLAERLCESVLLTSGEIVTMLAEALPRNNAHHLGTR
jgi:hypothetical protein